ncbi:acyl-CoA dehydrogenase family protein [Streptomyces sp. NRRL S-1448]|uniref:acyl-CoA dehydrogenase family protein n=1 Tax=Streptomyces sp. NRRL S-1448 TaxID=1463883 RepID=UPI00099C2D9B|nr:acyl-CoA dehydrogenase family protein [Streptomyces sp. NRRL S-1448]
MDFTPTEEQSAAQQLAARIFGDLATHDRLAAAGTASDGELWRALCAAGLPAAVEEIGLLGLALVLEEQGRTTAQVPLAVTCAYGVLAVGRHGTEEQRARLLPALRDGTAVATGAFPARGAVTATTGARPTSTDALPTCTDALPASTGAVTAPTGAITATTDARSATLDARPAATGVVTAPTGDRPATTDVRPATTDAVTATTDAVTASPSGQASVDGGTGWLSGVVPVVPWLRDATHVLVPDAERALWLVRVADARVEPVEMTAPWAAGRLTLDGTRAERLGGPRAERLVGRRTEQLGGPQGDGAADRPLTPYDDVLAGARIAFAALQAGVCAGALARTVAHTTTREQFGRPLSTNQAVLLRTADAYMDTEAIRVTTYEAAWRHDEGLPYDGQALTAAWWASEAGRRVVHTGQHLHGGIGADLGHPVHRHFLWGRQLDAHLGCGAELLEELGDLLTERVAEPVTERVAEPVTKPVAEPVIEEEQHDDA